MRVRPSHLALVIVVAFVAAVAWLLLTRPAVTAPTASPSASTVEAGLGQPVTELPPADPVPWEGVEWQLVEDAFGERDVHRRIDGLVDGGDQLVAWGRAPQIGRNQFNEMGAVWLSVDGSAWREVLIDAGVNAASTSSIGGVAVGPLGLLAYGSVCCEPESAAVWRSADGLDWRRVELQGDMGGYVLKVIGLEDGWVALGSSIDGMASEVWHSADGATWETALHVDGGRFAQALASLDRTPDGLVAVGTHIAADGSYDGGVWRSADGRHWERIGADDPALTDGEAQLQRIIGHGGGMLVSGVLGTAEQRRQCEELLGMAASLDMTPAAPPRPDATSCMSGSEQMWTSVDGAAWQPVNEPGLAELRPIEYRAVVPGGPGLVLLGEGSGPGSPDTTLFTSPDGMAWNAVGPQGPISEDIAIGLAVRDRQVLAVTEHWDGTESSFRAWIGTAAP